MKDPVLAEAKRLYDLGAAVHWLLPKSKRPVESGWTSGPRHTWDYLKKSYKPGLNLGVRLGAASKVNNGVLAVIDVDIKSKDPEHLKVALRAVKAFTGGKAGLPVVESGRGNGSRHIYFTADAPFKKRDIARSEHQTKVYMPSAKPSRVEKETLTAEELAEGIRLRPEWEVSILCEGQQVVLPPSIHPDSGKPYVWRRPLNEFLAEYSLDVSNKELPVIKVDESLPKKERVKKEPFDFNIVDVDVDSLNLHPTIRDMLVDGAGVEDRSAALMSVASALVKRGCTKDEVLSLLTNPDLFLGGVAYEHRKTRNRKNAARWLWDFTVKKVMTGLSAETVFSKPIEEVRELSFDEMAESEETFDDVGGWKEALIRSPKGYITNSMGNCYLILTKEFGEDLFRFNEFAKVDEQWRSTPWNQNTKTEFNELDVQQIKLWMIQRYGVQFSDDNIWSAIVNIGQKNKYHPIKEYIKNLPEWDGVPRVDNFLRVYMKGEAPEKYLQSISRKTICAMIARAFEPGIKFDTMLVLEGNQGLRKSTAIKALTGAAWFTDVNLDIKNKDSICDLNGKWVVEHSEMSVLSNHDVADLKSFLARQTDRMRPPYGRKSQDFPRQSVFIGSTNDNIYLKDKTGNRRFWPFKVTAECDIAAIEKDRDQIFAEAYIYYAQGEPLWIDDTETAHLAKVQQAERENYDELTEHIRDWLVAKEKENEELPFDEQIDTHQLKIKELFEHGGPIKGSVFNDLKFDINGQRRVGNALKDLGYERKVIWDEDKSIRKWVKK